VISYKYKWTTVIYISDLNQIVTNCCYILDIAEDEMRKLFCPQLLECTHIDGIGWHCISFRHVLVYAGIYMQYKTRYKGKYCDIIKIQLTWYHDVKRYNLTSWALVCLSMYKRILSGHAISCCYIHECIIALCISSS
jgi:hypothetical protein